MMMNDERDEIKLWAYAILAFFSAVLFYSGCTAETQPYIREQAAFEYMHVGPQFENPWFVDGPPLLISVANPLAFDVEVTSSCYTSTSNKEHEWTWKVPAKSRCQEYGQLMNRDLHSGACRVFAWRPAKTDEGYCKAFNAPMVSRAE